MQIVIYIPNSEIPKQQDIIEIPLHFIDGKVCEAGGYGFDVLPKGHGRLGDLDNIWNKLKELEEYYQAEFLKESNAIHESAMNGRLYGFTNSKFIVQDAPTIIEADKAESEDL